MSRDRQERERKRHRAEREGASRILKKRPVLGRARNRAQTRRRWEPERPLLRSYDADTRNDLGDGCAWGLATMDNVEVRRERRVVSSAILTVTILLICLGSGVGLLGLNGRAVAQEASAELLQVFGPLPTVDEARLFVVGPPDGGPEVGGIAVDRHGNVYVSEVGVGVEGGSIIMIPRQPAPINFPIRIIRGLAGPGDIEISADGRALVISEAGGSRISRHAFGITVLNANVEVPGDNLTVYAKTDLGPKKAPSRSPAGFYHIPDVLVPRQLSTTVDIVVQGTTLTKVYRWRALGQPGEAGPAFGQTIVDLAQ